MKKIVIITVVFLLVSCGGGLDDLNADLGNGYFYEVEGSRSSIGTNYSFKRGIYPQIKSYAYNRRYIIVKQKSDKQKILVLYSDEVLHNYLLMINNPNLEKDRYIKKFQDSEIWKNPVTNMEIKNLILKYKDNVKDYHKILDYVKAKALEDIEIKKLLNHKINYYIIDKKLDSIHGPFDSINFYKIKNNFAIDLQFDK